MYCSANASIVESTCSIDSISISSGNTSCPDLRLLELVAPEPEGSVSKAGGSWVGKFGKGIIEGEAGEDWPMGNLEGEKRGDGKGDTDGDGVDLSFLLGGVVGEDDCNCGDCDTLDVMDNLGELLTVFFDGEGLELGVL